MKKIACLIILLQLSFISNAQKKVFEKSVEDELFYSDKGPNKKSFDHIYIQYSLFPDDYPGAEINLLKSSSIGFGYRYKYKLASFYSLGIDINYLRNNFNLKQNSQKLMPNSLQHKNETLVSNNLSFEIYQRINIGKTGNMLGLYFDIGGYAGFVFMPKHIYKDKVSNEEYNSRIRVTKLKNVDYFEPFSYGFRTKLGYNKLGIIMSYQLSELLQKNYDFPKLPDWSLGLQFNIF